MDNLSSIAVFIVIIWHSILLVIFVLPLQTQEQAYERPSTSEATQ